MHWAKLFNIIIYTCVDVNHFYLYTHLFARITCKEYVCKNEKPKRQYKYDMPREEYACMDCGAVKMRIRIVLFAKQFKFSPTILKSNL